MGRYGNVSDETSSLCSGICDDGFECELGSTSPKQAVCAAGYSCLGGNKSACLPGSYSGSGATDCMLCPNDTSSSVVAADSATTCLPCLGQGEGSYAGSAECWPGIVSAVASNPPPVVQFYGLGDIVTIVFSKNTNQPGDSPITFTPSIGGIKTSWIQNGRVLIVQVRNC